MRYNVLQHLDTFIDSNFPFERILLFVTKDDWISRLLHDAAFCCQMGKLLLYVGKKRYWVFEILLSKHSLSQNNYYFNLYEFLKWWIHAFVERLKNRCFCWFPVAIFVPHKGTPTWHLPTKFYKSGWNDFPNISHAIVCIFIFDGMTVKTENKILLTLHSRTLSNDNTKWYCGLKFNPIRSI